MKELLPGVPGMNSARRRWSGCFCCCSARRHCVNIILFLGTGGADALSVFPFVLFPLVVVLMMVSYAFPLISQFRNDTKSVLKNALIFSVAYHPGRH